MISEKFFCLINSSASPPSRPTHSLPDGRPKFDYDLTGISFDPGRKKRRGTRQERALAEVSTEKKARSQTSAPASPPAQSVFHFGYSGNNSLIPFLTLS